MDERTVEAIARRAGLEGALEAFRDDVVAAAISAAKVTDRIRQSSATAWEPLSETLPEPLSELWPPMVVVHK
jgi:hypothetical protein